MAEKLSIRNFGPLKEIDLELKPIMVFIGPQGSGKSLLAKLIYFLKEVIIKFETEYPEGFGGNNYVMLTSDKIFVEEIFMYIKLDSEINYEGNGWKVVISKDPVRGMVIAIKEAEGENKHKKPTYFPSDRLFVPSLMASILNLIKNEVPLPTIFLEFGSSFEKARFAMPVFDVDFLGVTYKYENGEDRIYHNETEFVPLRKAASGYQSAIPMMLVVEKYHKEKSGYVFVVDEPEVSLYPQAQHNLLKYLVNKTQFEKDDRNELIITTHSPYLLSTFNVMLYAWKTGQKFPEKKAQIEDILPQQNWINPADFAAYYLEKDGTRTLIIGKETGLVSENDLDAASDDIMDEFDKILALNRTMSKNEK